MKLGKRQHHWGVVAQCHNPYREFAYCPLCNQFEENSGQRMSRKQFRELSEQLRLTDNPMYEADSDRLLVHQGIWR